MVFCSIRWTINKQLCYLSPTGGGYPVCNNDFPASRPNTNARTTTTKFQSRHISLDTSNAFVSSGGYHRFQALASPQPLLSLIIISAQSSSSVIGKNITVQYSHFCRSCHPNFLICAKTLIVLENSPRESFTINPNQHTPMIELATLGIRSPYLHCFQCYFSIQNDRIIRPDNFVPVPWCCCLMREGSVYKRDRTIRVSPY